MCFIWFALSFGFYGLTLWLPEVWPVKLIAPARAAHIVNLGCVAYKERAFLVVCLSGPVWQFFKLGGVRADDNIYRASFIVALANLPGNCAFVYN